MQAILKRLVRFVFGLQALTFLPMLPAMIYLVSKHGLPNSRVTPQSVYEVGVALSAIGVVYAGALFTMQRGWPSMRIWGVVASTLNLLFLIPLLFVRHSAAVNAAWIIPAAGAAGLYLFLNSDSRASLVSGAAKTPRIKGDCTNAVLDVLVWLLAAAAWIYGETWCIGFLRGNGIWYPHGLVLYAEYAVVTLLSILVHEFGHAFGGWSVGMKLRLFAFGPFSWQIRDGKWEFKFDSSQIFPSGGLTGNVPSGPEHQVWQSLLMIVAGPSINLGTGLIAVGLAVTLDPNSPVNAGGALLMFGIVSLITGATNLLPFRTRRQGYSDGARLLQLLNGGPAADIYFAQSFISSSLVTSLRPADYDMQLIERAAAAAQGTRLLRFRLCECQHYLDRQQMDQAREALARAELVYESSQASVPASLLPSLIFAVAYVKRDAASARRYWTDMEELERKTKTYVRRNVDYWIAECALQWSEHSLDAAHTAWHRGAAMANQLPAAGAYDFDRTKYLLMQKELDQYSAKFSIMGSVPQAAQPAWDTAF